MVESWYDLSWPISGGSITPDSERGLQEADSVEAATTRRNALPHTTSVGFITGHSFCSGSLAVRIARRVSSSFG